MEKIEQWSENSPIEWWNDGRKKLNKIIRKYNKWVDNKYGSKKLLNKIDIHLEKEYCNSDGGSGWKEELIKMKNNVKYHI